MICMIILLDLVLFVLWCTCFGLNGCAYLIGMVVLNVHKVNFFMKGPLLACFHDICAYGLILSTSGVLTPFILFPQHFRFRSLQGFWGRSPFSMFP